MQYATTVRTSARLNLSGDRLIDPEQKLIEPGIFEEGLTHCCCLPGFLGRDTGDSPLGQCSSCLRGFFFVHQIIRTEFRGNPSIILVMLRRTGQEYNQRKGRKGAFWEDRYHATAVETNEYLAQCKGYGVALCILG